MSELELKLVNEAKSCTLYTIQFLADNESEFEKFYNRFKDNKIFEGVMGWIRPAVVGLIGAAGIILMFKVAWSGTPLLSGFDFSVVKENFPHWSSWLLFAAAVIASLCFKVGPIPIILAGGILGFILY